MNEIFVFMLREMRLPRRCHALPPRMSLNEAVSLSHLEVSIRIKFDYAVATG